MMAWHNQSPHHHEGIYDRLKQASEQLAEEEEWEIPKDQLLVHIARLFEVFAAGRERNQEAALLRSAELIREAISTLGEEKGIAFLEETNPITLVRHIETLEYVRSSDTPCCTLDELRNQLHEFLAFKEKVEAYLVKTGLPPQVFKGSSWLFRHLGRLYDTRCTSSPYPHTVSTQEDEAQSPYRWLKYPPETSFQLHEIEEREYEDADLLPGMESEDAKRLEAVRSPFLAARKAVVVETILAIKRHSHENLLERCLDILDAKLERETLLFLLRMDTFYLGKATEGRLDIEAHPKMWPGGLTNLLNVVGHVEIELKTTRYDRLKHSTPQAMFELVFAEAEGTEGYLAATQRSDFPILTAALDSFCKQESVLESLWTRFGHRFAQWLDPNFRISFQVDVQPKYANRLTPLVREFVTHMETRANKGEPLVPVPSSQNAFRFQGSSWSIQFEGITTAQPAIDGFYYIAQLLQAPNEEIKAEELRRRIHRWKTPEDHSSREDLGETAIGSGSPDCQYSDVLFTASDHAGTTTDKEGLDAYNEQLQALEEAIATAKAEGKGELALQLEEERDSLAKFIEIDTDPSGRPRKLSANRKKAGDAVRNAINTALKNLRTGHPTLHHHLERYLDVGPTCCYRPPTPLTWHVSTSYTLNRPKSRP